MELRLRCVEASPTLALWKLPRIPRVRAAAAALRHDPAPPPPPRAHAFHSPGVRHGVVRAGGAPQLH